ncbi:MAG TPA: OmpA family protein [Thermoanaerobaculaceae bacterium]|nr:OmpA family protein [Thermoanaerobaculaceae bacterium]
MRKQTAVIGVAVVAMALGLSGCATKTYVQEQVGQAAKVSDAKIGEVQKQVEATQMDVAGLKTSDADQNQKIAQLSDTARDALARAQEAGKLAKGKFLYEVTLTDESVKFGFDRSELSAEAKAALDAFAKKLLAENKSVYVEVQGHTDSIGSPEYNLSLGQARAEAVMRYLNIQHGFPLHRMNAISYGTAKPIADNKTSGGRAKNRRVALVVLA